MKIPDVNILIYAHDASSPFQEKARMWLMEALLNRIDPVGIAPAAALGFIRLICSPRVFQNPLSLADACKAVKSWLDSGAIWVEVERDHFETVRRLLEGSYGGINMLTDAHLAALAIEQKATMYSSVQDFTRFNSLKVKNPVG